MSHSEAFLKLSADAKTRIREISAAEFTASVLRDAVLIDVREESEFAAGHIPGALHLSRGVIEQKIGVVAPDLKKPVVCYCAGGNRSALAADNLQKMGYTNVLSLAGGYKAWAAAQPGSSTSGIRIDIPGFGTLQIEHLVLDYNGTLAVDGVLQPGVAERIKRLAERVSIHVLTADTFGLAHAQLDGLPVELRILPSEQMHESKRSVLTTIGAIHSVAIGNGRNDRLMLEAAALGIGIIQGEGASTEALSAADVVVSSAADALDLLLQPLRLVATLRS